jgi:formylglycine-generating enzyme required for sulfatase activity
MALQLPARIGKYELEEFLGGGMSHVYRARDTVIGRTVAIKVLTDEGCSDVETKTRFLQEARLAGSIQHENVIHIYDFGEDEQQRPFMVMEFLRGEDLRRAIKEGRAGDLKERLRIAAQIARAIEYIHTLTIIHRDIKPENIRVTPNGTVKLMDFGIAKTEGFSMTRAGYVMGTPYYMAPEQVRGTNITQSVDIYAFGVLFFELLAGTRPFSGDTVERIFYSILNEPLDLEPLRQGGVPEAICGLIARCTAKDVAERPAGFGEVAQEIERVASQLDAPTEPPPAAPEMIEPPPGKPWMAIGIAVLVVCLLGAAVAYFLTRRHAPPPEPAAAAKPVAPTPPSPTLATSTGNMVLVDAGPFLFGKNRESVTLPAFYIDQTEVSNAAYQSFCQATGHALPTGFAEGHPDYPVVNVTIDDARQFAHWAEKRLPNSHEWEKAARGADGSPYPWGKDKDPARANVADNPQAQHGPMPVQSFDNGASPFHALQMVGNVWEFIDEAVEASRESVDAFTKTLKPPPRPGELWYQIRGESYKEPLVDEVMWDSSTVPARWKDPSAGFRCVRDAH